MFKKIIVFFMSFCFAFEQVGFAQIAGQLDISSRLSNMYNSIAFEKYRPLHLRYLSYDQLNNDFKLLLDKGSTKENKPEVLEKATAELLKYFFIGIALPNDTFWVNLRPDSPKEIIDENLAKTDIGKIMLECDLQLKKDTAKYTSPETLEGRQYWDKLYKRAEELYGSENITIPTLTRPWIVPDEIIVREAKGSAYIYKATLKVMLEQDYLKGNSNYSFPDEKSRILNEYSSQIIRETIIPRLTREVNSSKRYSSLRQVYYSLILAQWFKQSHKDTRSQVTSKIDGKDLNNLTSQAKWDKNTYFKAYQKSFKDGEYNVQENHQSAYGQSIRTYFSGGMSLQLLGKIQTGLIKSTAELAAALRGKYSSFTLRAGGAVAIEQSVMEDSTMVSSDLKRLLIQRGLKLEELDVKEFNKLVSRIKEAQKASGGYKVVEVDLEGINIPGITAEDKFVLGLMGFGGMPKTFPWEKSAKSASGEPSSESKKDGGGIVKNIKLLIKATGKFFNKLIFRNTLSERAGDSFSMEYLGPASIGGEKKKEFWLDKNGQLWIYKKNPYPDQKYRALGVKTYYKFMKRIFPDHPVEVHVQTYYDSQGFNQGTLEKVLLKAGMAGIDWKKSNEKGDINEEFAKRALKNLKAAINSGKVRVNTLAPLQVQQILQEMVIDWLFSNHDSHAANFIMDDAGTIIGIDKEQVFKFFLNPEKDKLDLNNFPNGQEFAPLYYQVLYTLIAQGKLSLSLIEDVLQKIEAIPESELVDLIRPFALEYAKAKEIDPERFIQDFLKRKRTLRSDFEGFFNKIVKQYSKSLDLINQDYNFAFLADPAWVNKVKEAILPESNIPTELKLKEVIAAFIMNPENFRRNWGFLNIDPSKEPPPETPPASSSQPVFNKNSEVHVKLGQMYRLASSLVQRLKNAADRFEAVNEMINAYAAELRVSGKLAQEQEAALEKTRERLIEQIRAPPPRVETMKTKFRLLSSWVAELRKTKSHFHRVYLPRDAGFFYSIDKLLEDELGPVSDYDAGSSVYFLSRARMSGEKNWLVYNKMSTIVYIAYVNTEKEPVTVFYRAVRDGFRKAYLEDAQFRAMADSVRQELIELGYDKEDKLIFVDTGFKATIPFFLKNVLDLNRSESELVDEAGEEKIEVAAIQPSEVLAFYRALFGFELDMFSAEERLLIEALAKSFNEGRDLGGKLENGLAHPMDLNIENWQIEESKAAERLEFFYEQILLFQMVLAFLERRAGIEEAVKDQPELVKAKAINEALKEDFKQLWATDPQFKFIMEEFFNKNKNLNAEVIKSGIEQKMFSNFLSHELTANAFSVQPLVLQGVKDAVFKSPEWELMLKDTAVITPSEEFTGIVTTLFLQKFNVKFDKKLSLLQAQQFMNYLEPEVKEELLASLSKEQRALAEKFLKDGGEAAAKKDAGNIAPAIEQAVMEDSTVVSSDLKRLLIQRGLKLEELDVKEFNKLVSRIKEAQKASGGYKVVEVDLEGINIPGITAEDKFVLGLMGFGGMPKTFPWEKSAKPASGEPSSESKKDGGDIAQINEIIDQLAEILANPWPVSFEHTQRQLIPALNKLNIFSPEEVGKEIAGRLINGQGIISRQENQITFFQSRESQPDEALARFFDNYILGELGKEISRAIFYELMARLDASSRVYESVPEALVIAELINKSIRKFSEDQEVFDYVRQKVRQEYKKRIILPSERIRLIPGYQEYFEPVLSQEKGFQFKADGLRKLREDALRSANRGAAGSRYLRECLDLINKGVIFSLQDIQFIPNYREYFEPSELLIEAGLDFKPYFARKVNNIRDVLLRKRLLALEQEVSLRRKVLGNILQAFLGGEDSFIVFSWLLEELETGSFAPDAQLTLLSTLFNSWQKTEHEKNRIYERLCAVTIKAVQTSRNDEQKIMALNILVKLTHRYGSGQAAESVINLVSERLPVLAKTILAEEEAIRKDPARKQDILKANMEELEYLLQALAGIAGRTINSSEPLDRDLTAKIIKIFMETADSKIFGRNIAAESVSNLSLLIPRGDPAVLEWFAGQLAAGDQQKQDLTALLTGSPSDRELQEMLKSGIVDRERKIGYLLLLRFQERRELLGWIIRDEKADIGLRLYAFTLYSGQGFGYLDISERGDVESTFDEEELIRLMDYLAPEVNAFVRGVFFQNQEAYEGLLNNIVLQDEVLKTYAAAVLLVARQQVPRANPKDMVATVYKIRNSRLQPYWDNANSDFMVGGFSFARLRLPGAVFLQILAHEVMHDLLLSRYPIKDLSSGIMHEALADLYAKVFFNSFAEPGDLDSREFEKELSYEKNFEAVIGSDGNAIESHEGARAQLQLIRNFFNNHLINLDVNRLMQIGFKALIERGVFSEEGISEIFSDILQRYFKEESGGSSSAEYGFGGFLVKFGMSFKSGFKNIWLESSDNFAQPVLPYDRIQEIFGYPSFPGVYGANQDRSPQPGDNLATQKDGGKKNKLRFQVSLLDAIDIKQQSVFLTPEQRTNLLRGLEEKDENVQYRIIAVLLRLDGQQQADLKEQAKLWIDQDVRGLLEKALRTAADLKPELAGELKLAAAATGEEKLSAQAVKALQARVLEDQFKEGAQVAETELLQRVLTCIKEKYYNEKLLKPKQLKELSREEPDKSKKYKDKQQSLQRLMSSLGVNDGIYIYTTSLRGIFQLLTDPSAVQLGILGTIYSHFHSQSQDALTFAMIEEKLKGRGLNDIKPGREVDLRVLEALKIMTLDKMGNEIRITKIDEELFKVAYPSIVVSPGEGALDGGGPVKKGGIDFRGLPIINQPGALPLPAGTNQLPMVNIADLDQEWQQIETMAASEIVPSTQRLKEFLGACCSKGALDKYAGGVLACIADILRLEEAKAKATEPALRDILILLESNRPESELERSLSFITVAAGEPQA